MKTEHLIKWPQGGVKSLLVALIAMGALAACDDSSSSSSDDDNGNGGSGSSGAGLDFDIPIDATAAADLDFDTSFSGETGPAQINTVAEAALATDATFLGSFTRILTRELRDKYTVAFPDPNPEDIVSECSNAAGSLTYSSPGDADVLTFILEFEDFCLRYPKPYVGNTNPDGELILDGTITVERDGPGNLARDLIILDDVDISFWGETFTVDGQKMDAVNTGDNGGSHRSVNFDISIDGTVYRFLSDRGSAVAESDWDPIVMQTSLPDLGVVLSTGRSGIVLNNSNRDPFEYRTFNVTCPEGEDPYPNGSGINLQGGGDLDLNVNLTSSGQCGLVTLSGPGTFSDGSEQQTTDFDLTDAIFD